ncbi:MAG: magnesium transporter [Puniceicoccales bacterium]|jgi:magnesium transporter|nr:magnesium transporter [Puniceicoccales bacterium]
MSEIPQNYTTPKNPEQYSFEELLELLDNGIDAIDNKKLSNTPSADVGKFLGRLTSAEQQFIIQKLSAPIASMVLASMAPDDSAEIVGTMRDFRAVRIIEELEPDDAVDLFLNLEIKDRERLIAKLPRETADTIRNLLKYDPNTAGGVMTPYVTILRVSMIVDEAIQHIRREKNETENTDTLYVIDNQRKLVGTTSVRNLIWAKYDQKVADIMDTDITHACDYQTEDKKVAQIMTESGLQTLPVIDGQGRLLGIVTHDDVINILQEAATSDIQKFHGAGSDETINDSIIYSANRRIPWLIVNLFTAMISTKIISLFSMQIQEMTALAAFMNLTSILGGNSGAQTLAIAIRGFALGDFHPGDARKVCLREAVKGFVNGLVIGLSAAIIALVCRHNILFSGVIFISIVLNMIMAGLCGAMIPVILRKLRFDPASSSYIMLTTITDSFGIFVFLSLGTMILL